jgi:hypothetical protein
LERAKLNNRFSQVFTLPWLFRFFGVQLRFKKVWKRGSGLVVGYLRERGGDRDGSAILNDAKLLGC